MRTLKTALCVDHRLWTANAGTHYWPNCVPQLPSVKAQPPLLMRPGPAGGLSSPAEVFW